MPNLSFSGDALAAQFEDGFTDASRDEVKVLLEIVLIPGQNKNVIQRLHRSWKSPGVVVDGLGSRQGERETTFAKGFLVFEELAQKRRFLNVSRRAGNLPGFQLGCECHSSSGDHLVIDAQAVLPIGMNAVPRNVG